MFGLRRQASVLASVRALREKLKTEEAASRRTPLVERLEQRQLLSVTSANMATPDGSNQIYEGGATAALVLTGKTSSGKRL